MARLWNNNWQEKSVVPLGTRFPLWLLQSQILLQMPCNWIIYSVVWISQITVSAIVRPFRYSNSLKVPRTLVIKLKFSFNGQFLSSTAYLCQSGYRSWHSDWLWAEHFGDRIPMKARFFAPVQTSPGAHPALFTMCNLPLSTGKSAGTWHWPLVSI
jgi:hypothetical protein